MGRFLLHTVDTEVSGSSAARCGEYMRYHFAPLSVALVGWCLLCYSQAQNASAPERWGAGLFAPHRSAECLKCPPCPADVALCGRLLPSTVDELKATLERRQQDSDSYAVLALLYIPGCPFCLQAWPLVKAAIARFPQLHAVALDVEYEPRFRLENSIIGVPALLAFSPAGVSRYSLDMRNFLNESEPGADQENFPESDKLVKFVASVSSCVAGVAQEANVSQGDLVDVWTGPAGHSQYSYLQFSILFLIGLATAFVCGAIPESW